MAVPTTRHIQHAVNITHQIMSIAGLSTHLTGIAEKIYSDVLQAVMTHGVDASLYAIVE